MPLFMSEMDIAGIETVVVGRQMKHRGWFVPNDEIADLVRE